MIMSNISPESLLLIIFVTPFFIGFFLATFGFLIAGIKLILFPGEDGFWGSMIKVQQQMNEFNVLAKKYR